MLRILFVAVDARYAVRSVTRSRDARGARTRRLRASRYLRIPLQRSLGPLIPSTRLPCFVRLRGWTSIPTLTTLRAALLPPLKGRAVRYEAPAFGRHYRVRAGGQSDGYRTHQRTVARFVGRVLLAIACQQDNAQISCRSGRVMATRRGYRASATTCRAVCPGGPTVKNSAQKRYFANRTVHSLYFHPAHGGDL